MLQHYIIFNNVTAFYDAHGRKGAAFRYVLVSLALRYGHTLSLLHRKNIIHQDFFICSKNLGYKFKINIAANIYC